MNEELLEEVKRELRKIFAILLDLDELVIKKKVDVVRMYIFLVSMIRSVADNPYKSELDGNMVIKDNIVKFLGRKEFIVITKEEEDIIAKELKGGK